MTTTESTTTATATTTTTTEQESNTTATTTTTNDSGANFRESQPIQPTKAEDAGEAGADKTDKTDTGGEKGRFGIAGKPSTKISFRILTNLSFSLKPYGGLPEKKKFCIKPGGVNGAIKPFTSSSGRKQFKKVGSRLPYTIQALLSVRDKLEFKTIPSEIEQIPGVFEEGLGNFEALINQTITLSSTVTEKISPSKLRKATTATDTSTVTTITTEVTSTYQQTARYEGNDDDASFRKTGPVTPSKIHVSKLKKREKVSPSIDEVASVETTKPMKESIDKPKPSETVSKPTIDTSQPLVSTESTPTTSTKASAKPLSSFRSKGAWGRGRKEMDPMQRLTKAITIRLNKITLDNFETLSDQLIGIFEKEITNTEQLTKLVSLIFEKTVQEHVYGPLYAKLCVALSSKNKSFDEIVFINGKKESRQVDFKNVLVKVCQNEFQKGKRPAVFTEDMDATDRENELFKQNQILKGTMKFIGQLYLKELIPSKIMTVCLRHLVGQQRPSDDDIEGACTLLETVGPTLDDDQTVNKNELTKYYQKLKSIQQNSNKYPVRIRMLVQNLIEKRKQNWKGPQGTKTEGPRVLKDRTKTTSIDQPAGAIFDPYDDALPFDFDTLMLGAAGSDAAEIMSIVPKSGHAVAQSQRKYTQSNRYSSSIAGGSNIVNVATNMRSSKKDKNKPLMTQRKKARSGGGRRRQLLQTAEEEQIVTPPQVMEEPMYEEKKESVSTGGGGGAVGIGQRKSRMALSSGSDRPCVDGKPVDEDTLEELTGDYLYVRNDVNEKKFLETLTTYKLPSDRSRFVLKFIQKAIDGGKGERFGLILPKLLNEYILSASEFDAGLIEFFKGYTFEDNPQLALNTAQLLAPLIVDNELNFNDVLQWVLLDTRDKQPKDDMLKFYDGDGVRNYPRRGSSKDKKITIVMELLGELFKELKEACFEDSQYVKKLLNAYNFSIDQYVNRNDIGNIDEIQAAWIKQYGLQFAF